MTFQRTRDVLENVRLFHAQVSDFYQCLSGKAEKQRIKFLLDYMSRREKRFENYVAQYGTEASQGIMDTWFQYAANAKLGADLKAFDLESDMTVDQVINIALKMDERLFNLYDEMARSADSAKVKDFFSSLRDTVQQEKNEFVRSTRELEDL